jgi:hypothetical protein
MRNIFLETSAINRAVATGLDPTALRDHLAHSDRRPVIGIHVIYELAATFLRPERVDTGKALFRFVRDLDPSFTPPTMDLLLQEVLRLRTNAAVLPFLTHDNQSATRLEVHRLAVGAFDATAQAFIEAREAEVRREHPNMANAYIGHVSRVREVQGDSLPTLRQFSDVAEYFRNRWPDMIRAIVHEAVLPAEARELAERLVTFPALRATLNANLYLMFICIAHGAVPGDDKLDDYRHLIDASYCEAMILYDDRARSAARYIAPQLQIESLEDLR